MQSRSSSRSFKPGLIGASPITDAILEIRNPKEIPNPKLELASSRFGLRSSDFFGLRNLAFGFLSAFDLRISDFPPPLCLQQLQGEFRKLVFVGASPTRGSNS